MHQKLLTYVLLLACGACTNVANNTADNAGPTEPQCATAVDHWLLFETQKVDEMVSEKALADSNDAVRATMRKSADDYREELPERRSNMIANCVAAKWKPTVLQCMHAVKKTGTSYCEELMGPGFDEPAAGKAR